jgi:hypothetical protein
VQLFYRGVKGPGTLRTAMSMWSYLEFMGVAHDAQPTYTLLAGLIGELYSPPVSLPLPGGIGRMLNIMGYAYELYTAQDMDKKTMSERIVKHMTETGRPALVITDLGEDGSWCFGGAVIGYEHNGDTLINWSYFPFDKSTDPQPVLNRNDIWYASDTLLIIIGERKTPSDFLKVYQEGIKAASDDLNHHYKKANDRFFADWKRILLQSENETVQEVKVSRKIPCTWGVFDDGEISDADIIKRIPEIVEPLWCDYAERRFYAARFCQDASPYFPGIKDSLNNAREAFDRIHDRMYEYIKKVDFTPDSESINPKKFNDPAIRREMAEMAAQCSMDEATAAYHLNNAASLQPIQT